MNRNSVNISHAYLFSVECIQITLSSLSWNIISVTFSNQMKHKEFFLRCFLNMTSIDLMTWKPTIIIEVCFVKFPYNFQWNFNNKNGFCYFFLRWLSFHFIYILSMPGDTGCVTQHRCTFSSQSNVIKLAIFIGISNFCVKSNIINNWTIQNNRPFPMNTCLSHPLRSCNIRLRHAEVKEEKSFSTCKPINH